MVAVSDSLTGVLKHFGLRPAGGNHRHLRSWIDRWGIPTDHFTYGGDRLAAHRVVARPLEEVLVEHSTYARGTLKKRLYAEGLKDRRCELCGQGEEWRGEPLSLILDHINGVADDNRLENLRIVCPNCNATLSTHCGRNTPRTRTERPCALCQRLFMPNSAAQRYCSRACGQRNRERPTGPRPEQRKVERPPYAQLLHEIETSSWSAVGRRYGVSCNAVRKWVQAYQTAAAEAGTGSAGVAP